MLRAGFFDLENEAICSFETSLDSHQNTRCFVSEITTLQQTPLWEPEIQLALNCLLSLLGDLLYFNNSVWHDVVIPTGIFCNDRYSIQRSVTSVECAGCIQKRCAQHGRVDVSKHKNACSKHNYVRCIEISLSLICKCSINAEALAILQRSRVRTVAKQRNSSRMKYWKRFHARSLKDPPWEGDSRLAGQ